MNAPPPSDSPKWSASSKRTVMIILFVLFLLLLYRIRLLLAPMSLAIILAYLIEPGVKLLTRYTPLNRLLSILLIYLGLVAFLVSLPVTAVTPIINQGTIFVRNIPRYLNQLGVFFSEPIVIFEGYEIPIDQLPLDQTFASLSANLVDIVQTLGGQTLSIFGVVATATLSTVGWLILILFISFYLVKDHDRLFSSFLALTPPHYHQDIGQLSRHLSMTWNAFLRGQLVLCIVVGFIVFVIALILGLPNASSLAIFAGFMELVPTFGPILAAIPAVLIALFQTDASWLGGLMTPFWFGFLVLGIYALIYQFENYVLVPRIIGYHLKLHPLLVLLGVVGGASIAGILGIILAAPVLASARLILLYIYDKLTDRTPFFIEENVVVAEETTVADAEPPPDEDETPTPEEKADNIPVELEQS